MPDLRLVQTTQRGSVNIGGNETGQQSNFASKGTRPQGTPSGPHQANGKTETLSVRTFLLEVAEQLKLWPEAHQRRRQGFTRLRLLLEHQYAMDEQGRAAGVDRSEPRQDRSPLR